MSVESVITHDAIELGIKNNQENQVNQVKIQKVIDEINAKGDKKS